VTNTIFGAAYREARQAPLGIGASMTDQERRDVLDSMENEAIKAGYGSSIDDYRSRMAAAEREAVAS